MAKKKTENKHTVKSVTAVFLGFVTVVILSTVTDMILESIGIFPPPDKNGLFIGWMLLLALVYRCLYTVVGGYITGRLAPSNPRKHIKVLGIIGTFAGILGIIAGWNLSDHWYPIALAVTAFPCIWFGGVLAEKKK